MDQEWIEEEQYRYHCKKMQEKLASVDTELAFYIFQQGFMTSAEGFNGEWGCGNTNKDTEEILRGIFNNQFTKRIYNVQ
jgi:hypothetical protein